MKTWDDLGIAVPLGVNGEFDTTCPFCSHTRKKQNARCLSGNTDTGVFYCHHCGAAGTLKEGIRDKGGDPRIAYGESLRRREWQAPRPIPPSPPPTLWQRTVDYFRRRGIPEEVVVRNRITAATMWCPVCEDRVPTILFPYYRDGVHVNTKYRCFKKHFRMDKGAERIFYGLDDCAGADAWIVVEGEFDKLACEVAGHTNVVSVPDGAPPADAKSYDAKLSFLASAADRIEAVREIVIAVDADGPGYKLEDALATRIDPGKCRHVVWPDGIKDANECLTKVGPEYLAGLLGSAEPMPVEGIFTAADLWPFVARLYDEGVDRGVTAGWPKLDRLYRARAGLFTVLTGIPSHGKSRWLDHLMVRYANRHGWHFAVCSPEQQPLEQHAADIVACYRGQPFHDGPTERMSRAAMVDAEPWFGEHFTLVLPENQDLDTILAKLKSVVLRQGARGVVIDPWSEIEAYPPPGVSSPEHINQCLSKMRAFARRHKVHLWLVAHPTKIFPDKRNEPEPVPTLYDISGSAHFRNKADYGVVVYRDLHDTAKPVQVHVKKVRFDETGDVGTVEFWYDPPTRRYREA